MDQDEPGRHSPQSGGQRPVSTVRSYSRLRSYTGHGNLTNYQSVPAPYRAAKHVIKGKRPTFPRPPPAASSHPASIQTPGKTPDRQATTTLDVNWWPTSRNCLFPGRVRTESHRAVNRSFPYLAERSLHSRRRPPAAVMNGPQKEMTFSHSIRLQIDNSLINVIKNGENKLSKETRPYTKPKQFATMPRAPN